MGHHGRCRCGAELTFRRGPDGYKTRCPKCSAVVRLRPDSRHLRRRPRFTCACGAVIVLGKDPPAACPCCHQPLPLPEGATPALLERPSRRSQAKTQMLGATAQGPPAPSNGAAPPHPEDDAGRRARPQPPARPPAAVDLVPAEEGAEERKGPAAVGVFLVLALLAVVSAGFGSLIWFYWR